MNVMGRDLSAADTVFRNYVLKEGRNEVFQLSRPCTINLIKNPTGANEVMKFILGQPGDKNICIFLNDNDQDGHDVSWIWDAHFERLNDPSVKTIVCSGTRPYDMALRLKYEGLEDRVMVIENARDAIRWLDEANLESHVISTYTALHSTRAVLRKQEGRHHK
jgi:UDP-N-acetylmuramyl tripeptide synthase